MAFLALAQGGRHPIQKIPVPGDYGWDYLTADMEGRRLYVSHDQEVVLLDFDSLRFNRDSTGWRQSELRRRQPPPPGSDDEV
jgi:hypothetical protein